ncbi:MAG: hypothetical protein IPL16_18215 [Ignavibacteria bacterium]|nr:hypothetical protein [Ignavibacteria bacterium]
MKINILFIFIFAISSISYSSCKNKENDSKLISNELASEINANDTTLQTEKNENSKHSGSYKGIYFEEDDGATIKMDIYPIILINDTCKYLYYGEVLISDFSIEENLISFNQMGTIFIGEAIIEEEDEDYGTVIYKTSDNEEKRADGMIQKISDITEINIDTINNVILNENNLKQFWSQFIQALSIDDINQIAEYVSYPFEDKFSVVYKKTNLGAKNKTEFKNNYNKIFTSDIKESLLAVTTGYFHNTDIYILEFINPTIAFIFKKQNGNWKLTQINAGGG